MQLEVSKVLAEIDKQLPSPDPRGLVMTNRQAKLILPGVIQCVAEVRCIGLESISDGNKLIAGGVIWLPAGHDGYLVGGLVLGERVIIGESLLDGWGFGATDIAWPKQEDFSESKVKWRRSVYLPGTGSTWIEALMATERLTIRNIATLWKALQDRQDALRSDGEEYFLAKGVLP